MSMNEDCNFDPRELQEFLDSWLKEHPNGKASKLEVISSFASMAGGIGPDTKIAQSIVDAMDRNGDGEIDFREAVLGLSVFMRGRPDQKVRLLFAALDTDGSRSVSKNELKEAFQAQVHNAHGTSNSSRTCGSDETVSSNVTASVDAIFAKADLDGDGVLSLDEFLKVVREIPELHLHFSMAEDAYNFNHPEASTKKRLICIQRIAESRENLRTSGQTPRVSLTAEIAVEVLQTVPGLSPVAIGEFLGGRDEDGFAEACANLFFASLQLQGTHLDEAIRLMSHKLCLPREAQQIDRLIQSFAAVYCRDNPEKCSTQDEAYLTAFAIVMLNADAHSVNNKKKMTKAEFIRNCSLATPGVDKNLLDGIYDRVTLKEIRLSPDESKTLTIEKLLSDDINGELATTLNGLRKCSESD